MSCPLPQVMVSHVESWWVPSKQDAPQTVLTIAVSLLRAGLSALRFLSLHVGITAPTKRKERAELHTVLGVDSPFFSTIVLLNNQLFPQGWWFSGKKDPWKAVVIKPLARSPLLFASYQKHVTASQARASGKELRRHQDAAPRASLACGRSETAVFR